MPSIAALTILLVLYGASELIAQKTKAIFSTVLAMAILLLTGFWTGILPETLFTDAKVVEFGNVVAGLLIVSLATTLDFDEIRRQWKVVVTALMGVIFASCFIIFIGSLIIDRDMALSGAPIFVGGSAATLIMTNALKEINMELAATFCVVLYVTQKFIGVPIASMLMRKEAKEFLRDPKNIKEYSKVELIEKTSKKKLITFSESWNRPSIYLAKLSIVACISFYLSQISGGKLHYFVVCLLVGVVFFAIGFLDKGILEKTQASGLIIFLVTVVIFTNLATTSIEQVIAVLLPLLVVAALGVSGILVAGFICSKLLKMGFGLAVCLGISCTFGFPTTMLMSKEVAEALGNTKEEQIALENYLLPKMLTAGIVTVTVASVIIAGVVVNKL